MPTLDELNALPAERFAAALDGIFEHAPWVPAAVAAQRPFATVTALHDAMMAVVRAKPQAEQIAFLCNHPALSSKALASPDLTAASRAEQGGLGLAALGGDLSTFEAGSAEYTARLGIPFIVCVRRLTPTFVLKALQRRLHAMLEDEIVTALTEIGFITRLRVADRVTGPGMPGVGGCLSSHVLDTARGRPAAGVKLELFREGVLIREAVTNRDGRTDKPLIEGEPLRIGRYEIRFHVAEYFADLQSVSDPPWYDMIPVRFAIAEPEGHYHMPLLLGAWTYTTYRGS